MIIVAFDVDKTLRDGDTDDMVLAREIFRAFLVTWASMPNVRVHVWSGSGELYARQVCGELGLRPYVDSYSHKIDAGFVPDIVFDDEVVTLGKINIQVPS